MEEKALLHRNFAELNQDFDKDKTYLIFMQTNMYLILGIGRNIFRTGRGCVLITEQNLRKFEFFYCAPEKFKFSQPISVLKLF